MLLASHSLALNPLSSTLRLDLTPAQADAQFRIDFFEFYVLLERCLLHLLNSVGIRVSAGHASGEGNEDATTLGQEQQRNIIGNRNVFRSTHAFHANLLSALNDESPRNPLHSTLGSGRVKDYIGLAKELRNSWKDDSVVPPDALEGYVKSMVAGLESHDTHLNGGLEVEKARTEARLQRKGYAALLGTDALRLDEMLRVILSGMDEAVRVAEREIERFSATKGSNSVTSNDHVASRRLSVDMTDTVFEGEGRGDLPWESASAGADWAGDEMEFD
jgi:hypothetical protein